MLNSQSAQVKPLIANAITQEYQYTNNNFVRFLFLEKLNVKSVPKNNGRGSIEQVPLCDENLIKRINALVNNQTFFTQQQTVGTGGTSNANPQVRQATIYYKMLKCESKLVRFIFEINGLVPTDRHDWNMLWTHTQGKNYFYERLNQS